MTSVVGTLRVGICAVVSMLMSSHVIAQTASPGPPQQTGIRGVTAAPRPPRGPYANNGLPPGPIPAPPTGTAHITVKSSIDGTDQDSILVTPSRVTEPKTVAVYLHGWSVTDTDRRPDAEAEAEKRGWYLLTPNMRGPYDHVDGCGSKTMQQDVLDAVAFTQSNYGVNAKRVYLVGFSGGGLMAMMLAALHPGTFAAISEWAGTFDMAAWYADHATDRYATGMNKCFGGPPTGSTQLAAIYRDASPIGHLTPQLQVPLDMNAQKDDPTVADTHSLHAFQAVVPGLLTDAEVAGVIKGATPLAQPYTWTDPATGRHVYLRKQNNQVRLTIREGGHEMFAKAAFEWFDQFQGR
jgi:pimeloyl-ACP methyl ester carboxylesterase